MKITSSIQPKSQLLAGQSAAAGHSSASSAISQTSTVSQPSTISQQALLKIPQNQSQDTFEATFSDQAQQLWQKAKSHIQEDGWVYAAGAGLYAGIGTAVGSLVGAPLIGAAKGLQIFGLQAGGDAIMNTKTFESSVFNWSKTMPGNDETPRDLNYEDPKTRVLFHANLATNAAVILSIPAAAGAVLFGAPGALAVGALALAAAPLAELM